LKELEEAQSRRPAETREKLLSRGSSLCSQSQPRGRSLLLTPPRSLPHSPTASPRSCLSGASGQAEAGPCLEGFPQRPTSRRVSFELGTPSVASTENASEAAREEPAEPRVQTQLPISFGPRIRPMGSFRSQSWPSSNQQPRRAGTVSDDESLKFGSLGNTGFTSRQRTTTNVIFELDQLASAQPEGTCWRAALVNVVGCLRWWAGLREPERRGPLARIVRSRAFSAMSMCFILFDAVLTAYSSNYLIEHLTVDRTATIIAMETCILAFYVVELLLKLALHRVYFFLSEDWRWNVTDMLVVCNSVMVLGGFSRDINFTFVRACRIFRLARIVLLFRAVVFVKQLRVMMECVLNCFLNLFWCIVLVVFISYIFALFLVQHLTQYLLEDPGLDEEGREHLLGNFGSVQRTLLTLFKVATGGDDWDRFYQMIVPTGGLGPPLFLFFVAFFTIAVWNIITSLFIEVAMSRVRPTTRELMIEKHHQDMADVKELTELFLTIDTDESNYISREEFTRFTEDAEAMEALQVRGLDIKDRNVFFQMLTAIDSSDHRVGLEEFVDGCLKMRGPATSLDLHVVKFESLLTRKTIMRALRAVALRLEGVERALAARK